MTPHAAPPRSRILEDVGFLVGILLAVLYVLGVHPGPAQPPAWAAVCIILTCIAPKLIGRATTGRVWTLFASRGSGPPPA